MKGDAEAEEAEAEELDDENISKLRFSSDRSPLPKFYHTLVRVDGVIAFLRHNERCQLNFTLSTRCIS